MKYINGSIAILALIGLSYAAVADQPNEPVTKSNNPTTVAKTVAATASPAPAPHCEVPCGIYADQMRFEQMLEDTATIAKAITNITEFAGSLGDGPTAKSINQATRWVNTKEDHATKIQHTASQYFLTQRIKSDHKDYTSQLVTAHKVIVAAMKCKQDADPATAETLKKSILDLYRAYEGKEPTFHTDEKK